MRFNTSLIAIAVLATVAHAKLEGQLKTVAEGLQALKFDEKATDADAKAKVDEEAKELEAAKAALDAELVKKADAHHAAAVAASQTSWYMLPFAYP